MVKITRAGVAALATFLLLAATAAARPSAFPVTVKASNGSVALAAKPLRIVSLSPTATEDLFAIGAGPQVVAVDDESDYPKNAPITKLSGYTPNAEAVAAYKPDLVVASFDSNGLFAALAKLHIPALLETPAPNLAGEYAQIDALGKATGHTVQATALVAKLRREIASIVASVPKSSPQLSVYEELSTDYYTATSKTFIGQVFKLFGLKNIADPADKSGSGYPKLSGEYIIASDPSLIVLADTKCCGQTAAKVAARPGWNTIAAVKDGGVVGVSDDVASRWGPRIVDFMRSVAKGILAVRRHDG
jgi:cobalamin transport system substrate-binding protein